MLNTYYATINWQGNTPISSQFNDIYFSPILALEEINYVFIQHNQLSQKFAQLKDQDRFILAETGFGSGLNFLMVLSLWQQIVTTQAQLIFISFEQYPLSSHDLQKILSNFPQLTRQSQQLIAQYYLPLPATHRFSFTHNVYLNLIIGDIQATIFKHNFLADAWFFDGFAPAKNPQMWQDKVMQQINRLTKPNGTFATFTASSKVRKTLSYYGFQVVKDRGFNKREMLYGFKANDLISSSLNVSSNKTRPKPWLANYSNYNLTKKVIIIGGGISGAATAYSLAKRGYQVVLYEKNSALALEASGNYQAMLYGSFFGNYTPMLELSFAGYRYSHHLITSLLNIDTEYQPCGLLQLATTLPQLKQQEQILASNLPTEFCRKVNNTQICTLAGIPINCENGLYFPFGLWLNPSSLVYKLANGANIHIVTNTTINALNFTNGQWQIQSNNKILDFAPNLVLCNANSLTQFAVSKHLPLRKIRGQISIINHKLNLKTIICANGYLTPNLADKFTLGATFKFDAQDLKIKEEEHQENINNLLNIIPNLTHYINWPTLQGQANFRATTFDYLPLVGPLANYCQFKQAYQLLAKDANYRINTPCPYLPGLYINAAHGSKGILTAPISGEIIADYLDNTPHSCSENLRLALHPNRFWAKQLIKNEKG